MEFIVGAESRGKIGAQSRNRTNDTGIFNLTLHKIKKHNASVKTQTKQGFQGGFYKSHSTRFS